MRVLVLVLVLVFAAPAFAQTPPDCQSSSKISVAWDAYPSGTNYAPVDHTEISRADGDCSTATNFVKVYSGGAAVLGFDDINVQFGKIYCYVGNSFGVDGKKSADSNKTGCKVPFPPPPPVQNLRAK